MDNPPPLANYPSTATITTTNEAVSTREVIEDVERTEPEHRVQLGSSKTFFSPFQRLPLEILGETFLMVVSTSKTRPSSYQKALTRLPLVCRSWRDAAFLTPRLWSHCWVRADAPSISYDSLNAWISRAGAVPKSLELTLSNCGGVSWPHGAIDTNLCAGSSCRFANPTFSTILKRPRGSWDSVWDSVTLNCPTPSCLRNFITALQEDQPDLDSDSAWSSVKSFTLVAASWTRWVGPSHRRSLQDLTFIPTSVTSLSIRLPIMTPELQLWDRPLHIQPTLLRGLTSLEVVFGASFTDRDIEASVIFAALQHCQELETLKIDFSQGVLADAGPNQFERSAILLPRLRYLRFHQACGPSTVLLPLLEMPNLLDMYLSFDMDGNIDDTTTRVTTFSVEPEEDNCEDVVPLADFIRGYGSSTSRLRSLHIRAADFFLGALYHLLRELHSLVDLTLEWVSMIYDTPDFLSLIQHQPPCLPQLRVLKFINYRGPDGFEIPHLRSFAESRGIQLTFSSYDVFENASRTDIQRYQNLIDLPSDSEYED